ncbi:hypothetical protein Q9Q95_14405 [Sphingomonas sp. DG1-23]|uniref:hypothetical protein n=1 Tax=Sphingomonas sp. DG1-23 TaxID=3068316 RepID=UPI002740021E|nr:hypothetical protein [Sphingomonas sp. DG1-23]MDP5280118.1 hypothetical protein [Sphingomonas sp. DG1-23]
MKTSVIGASIVFLLFSTDAASQSAALKSEAYEITKSYKASDEASDGSSGSSNGRDTLLERVIARRDGGIELEYDLPDDATPQDRARNWQFPARVFEPLAGPKQLLNADALQRRLEHWLKAAKWDRTACGRWIFTWNAFRIECDPQSVIGLLAEYDLTSQNLRPGTLYLDVRATEPQPLARKEDSSAGVTFIVVAKIDPGKVRLERAEADVAVGEMTQEPLSREAALRERMKEQVSGSVVVTWDVDDAGAPRKRTKTIAVEIKRPDGTVEKRMRTEIVERRRVPAEMHRNGS